MSSRQRDSRNRHDPAAARPEDCALAQLALAKGMRSAKTVHGDRPPPERLGLGLDRRADRAAAAEEA